VVELELLCGQYGVKREIGGRKISPLVNSIAIKRELFAFNYKQLRIGWIRVSKMFGQ
jgi:hypothetical protein